MAFAGVYGPNNDYDRKVLRDELVGIISRWENPWCIGGDFNAIRYQSEIRRYPIFFSYEGNFIFYL
jgi:hypothetical protein